VTRARRTRLIVGIAAAALFAALGVAFYLRGRAAPEAARLLPEAETVLYFNLKPVRLLTHLGDKPVEHEPEYEDFVRETGFQFERDLDEGAFAVHSSASQNTQPSGDDYSRYSELLVGRFNSTKVSAYLRKLSSSIEQYRTRDIYNIPHDGRVVRVSILSPDMVAASNTVDASAIHYMIDQYERVALPFGGPALVRRYYREVPFGSLAWIISDVPTLKAKVPRPWAAQIFTQFLARGVVVASLRYTAAIQLRADTFVGEAQAADLAEHLNDLLALFRDVSKNAQSGSSDPDLKAAVDSIKIEPRSDRVSLTATLPADLVAKIFQAPVESIAPEHAEKPQSRIHPRAKRR
jgi:hypothetical protein